MYSNRPIITNMSWSDDIFEKTKEIMHMVCLIILKTIEKRLKND